MTYGSLPGGTGGHGSQPPGGGSGGGPTGGYGPPGGYYPPPNGPGHPPPAGPYGHRPPGGGTNGMAVAALVLAVVGLVMCGIPSILGAVFGHVAMRQIRRTGEEGRGMAIAALVVSYAAVVIWIVFWFAFLGAMSISVPTTVGGY
ncbi:DUF4190 domain-containing protein [Planotetraspora kaengkrachanensis]|uniref:DUF4190 domain-containing protein n=1 Tax=Planotetraspora kaengkrachanensis TaxID=575193 RepID=A0A8J3PRC3_9ACTN|nr:DUF4190 domain-containing protein [Planotetraspora kaengkrachanensis]GIG76976.1 hypothetical protein Pka01_01030 [Planotetraspora kaengkrachanensis]